MKMTQPQIDEFLATTRLGMLTTLREDGSPVTVPVWFEWDGETVRIFSSVTSPKLRRIGRDPRATLLAPNHIDEPEAWVAFDGEIAVSEHGAFELAERMAQRYWDMTNPERQATVASWREAAPHLRVLSMRPSRVRSYKD
jgi:PPOX class probable F420-dependent enzyme